jgi:hypothetical protein
MHQREASDIILGLLPEFEKRDPGEVLLKVARTKGMAPAQLEKLGTTFNTMSVLMQQERDRNTPPVLLDVLGMTREYVDNYKAASAVSIFDDEPIAGPVLEKAASVAATPDVRRELGWGVTVPIVVRDSTPKPVHLTTREKWAAVQGTIQSVTDHCRRYDELLGAAFTATDKLAEKIASSQDPARTLATLQRDLNEADGIPPCFDIVKVACEERGVTTDIQVGASVLRRDHTGLMPHLKLASARCEALVNSRETIFDGLEQLKKAQEDFAGDIYAWRAISKAASEAEKILTLLTLGKSASPERYRDEEEKEKNKSKRSPSKGTGTLQAAEEAFEDGRLADGFGSLTSAGVNKAVETLNATGDAILQGLPRAWEQFTPRGEVAKFMDETWGEDNRKARANTELDLKRVESDTRSVAALQRLMLTDEVLSKKDPEKVFEAFQTIRRASPEVASDPSLLRLMLRQALETQGVDIDTASAGRSYEFGQYKTTGSPAWSNSTVTPTNPRD